MNFYEIVQDFHLSIFKIHYVFMLGFYVLGKTRIGVSFKRLIQARESFGGLLIDLDPSESNWFHFECFHRILAQSRQMGCRQMPKLLYSCFKKNEKNRDCFH